ncbi:MAG: ribose 1,5-bisphosphate isomerase [Candidatus Methanomethylophilaceae archaeon]|jgi:ribose 1,5-bisphosphate isomerase|nr:ribose 1,5-bisphosphate isomerase [Candidatus Methanomethylophilaceae archaeon]MDD2778974.1 ribose 1,5-bisphosphate isomerase [Candidatus Methanomethylophilaceae archaeon]MDD3127866.1 ribose 1,5-bisphosphate isomerase [Candidatus Methanomethylophilaceae archaeon]MDD4454716.1 ribose 1,5-bisphosphate isomerase [Candidatus Methanomethylophilaceae archaeon]
MNVNDTAADIKSMKIRGAGKIARAGAKALSDFADSYEGRGMQTFLSDLEKAKRTLLDSRPTAVSLWNGVHFTLRGVADAKDVGEAAALIVSNAERFIVSSENAVKVIGEIGAKRVQDGDTILTICNSSAAISVMKAAHRQNKNIRVYATETRPWRQGILTARELAAEGIDTTLVVDSAVRSVMKKVDKVFVGADTVTSHGSLINKVGTSHVALAAHEARVQFYVCAETYKFSPMTLFGDMVTIEERPSSEISAPGELPDTVKIYNPVFDSTPAAYIDAIITELGMMSPGAVFGVMTHQLGYSAMQLQELR